VWESCKRYPHQLGEAHAPRELVDTRCPVGHAPRLLAVGTRARGSRIHEPALLETLLGGFRGVARAPCAHVAGAVVTTLRANRADIRDGQIGMGGAAAHAWIATADRCRGRGLCARSSTSTPPHTTHTIMQAIASTPLRVSAFNGRAVQAKASAKVRHPFRVGLCVHGEGTAPSGDSEATYRVSMARGPVRLR
jgi:hypothetical protein